LNLPASTREIGFCAFAECKNLEEVELYKMEPPIIYGCVFGRDSNLKIIVPTGSEYGNAEYWKEYTIVYK
jgi:hypothetical protein